MAEITSCLDVLAPYLKDRMVLNVGFGGALSCPHEISMDRPEGDPNRAIATPPVPPTHLWGDARRLYWFKDGALGALVSSHVLEDFPVSETKFVLAEWLRVIQKGGYLCLFLPDQKRYVAHCQKHGTQPNAAHKIDQFSMQYVKDCLNGLPAKVILEIDPYPGNAYSFLIVAEKL